MLRIKHIIKSRNLTYKDVAQGMGVSETYVSEVANEHKNLTLETLKKFADYFGIPVIALFEGYREPDDPAAIAKVQCPYCGNLLKIMRD